MRILVVAAVLAVSACSPAPEKSADASGDKSTEAAAPSNCNASASSSWAAGGDETLTVEGTTTGADCAGAEARFTLRRPGGSALYEQAFPANQIMVLAGATSVADMKSRLQAWVGGGGAALDNTSDLPEWAAGAANPGASEFPFHPYGGMDRAAYETLRAANAPMLCFVQGMESQACFWLDAGALRRIGEQQIPG